MLPAMRVRWGFWNSGDHCAVGAVHHAEKQPVDINRIVAITVLPVTSNGVPTS